LDLEAVRTVAFGQAAGPRLRECPLRPDEARSGPRRLVAPCPADLAAQRIGRGRALRVHDDRRLSVDAVVLGLQPAIEPPQHLDAQSDVRSGEHVLYARLRVR